MERFEVGPLIGASVVLALVSSSARSCGDDDAAGAPSIAIDGERLTLAWDGDGAIYAQQFDARGKALAPRTTVFRDDGLRGGAAIVRTATGYVALGTHHHRDAEKDYTNRLFSVRLDANARVVGEPHMYFFGDSLCGTPVSDGNDVLAAVRMRATSHRHPHDMLLLYVADDTKSGDSFYTIASTNFGACATATNGREVVVGYRRRDHESGEERLIMQFDARRSGPQLRIVLPQTAGIGLAVVAIGDEWAAMYGEGDDAVTVLRIGRDGVHSRVTLPGVDPGSADLAATERGLIVSWRDRGSIRLTAVESGRTVRASSAGARPSDTAAASIGGRCATAWTNRGGRRAQVEVTACP